jgi:predicted HD phosphohydrolase
VGRIRSAPLSTADGDFAKFVESRWPQLSKGTVSVDSAVSVISELFRSMGNEPYFGEPVTHQEHALQCAALAESSEYNHEDVIVAALLHDIGHICAPDDAPHMNTDGGPDVGVVDHETVGRDLLQLLGFSDFVTELVQSHVPSKRYLVSVDEEYKESLAEDSRRSLMFQGGFMTKEELKSFDEQNSSMKDIKLAFRMWDEKGKIAGVETPTMEHYLSIVERHLQRERGGESLSTF